MAKPRVEFVCRECGYRNPRALGRCPECDAWGSFDEVAQIVTTSATATTRRAHGAPGPAPATPLRLADISSAAFDRLPVSIDEFARVLGGGIVKGSLTLIGGDPGVGKSTLLSQIADDVARHVGEVLYVSGEESVAQIGLRARRMCLNARDLLFLGETDADSIVETIRATRAAMAVIHSIHSVMASDVEALPGRVPQLR